MFLRFFITFFIRGQPRIFPPTNHKWESLAEKSILKQKREAHLHFQPHQRRQTNLKAGGPEAAGREFKWNIKIQPLWLGRIFVLRCVRARVMLSKINLLKWNGPPYIMRLLAWAAHSKPSEKEGKQAFFVCARVSFPLPKSFVWECVCGQKTREASERMHSTHNDVRHFLFLTSASASQCLSVCAPHTQLAWEANFLKWNSHGTLDSALGAK